MRIRSNPCPFFARQAAMAFFDVFSSSRRRASVQRFLMRFLNETRSRGSNLAVDGPRRDARANLAIEVLVVPQVDGTYQFEQSFAAVTKDFSAEGMSLILNQPLSSDALVVGVRYGEVMTFLQSAIIYQ